MKTIIRWALLYLVLNSNVHAIVSGEVDTLNTYSSVGYTLTTAGGLGSVVALDPYWVLTAAHVVESPPAMMVMGDPNTGTEGLYFYFDQVIIHPDYIPGEFHDDLALIKLSAFDPINPVPGVVDASFATLSNVNLSGGLPSNATVTGYGLTSIDGPLDPNEPLLRRYGVAAIDPAGPIAPPFDPGFPIDCSLAMLLCTYDTTGGAPGDSGGAMWLDYGSGEIVAGINSFIFDESDLLDPPGDPDWTNGYWTVATSTAYYQDWITSHVPTAMFGNAPVPIPAAIWLFGSGLIGIIGIAIRKRLLLESV
jgi:secreted trypsin-like serine protease